MRKFCFVKSETHHTSLRPDNQNNACKGFVWESRIPHSILVHYLWGKEVYNISLRYRIRISIASKIMDLNGMWNFFPKYTFYQYSPKIRWAILPNKIDLWSKLTFEWSINIKFWISVTWFLLQSPQMHNFFYSPGAYKEYDNSKNCQSSLEGQFFSGLYLCMCFLVSDSICVCRTHWGAKWGWRKRWVRRRKRSTPKKR